MTTPLQNLQSLLYRLITAVSGVGEGLAGEPNLARGGLGQIVIGDDRLSAEERVDIYANMYFYRLLDALREDFPATNRVLGDDAFHNLVTGYLIEHPPTEPSIFYCGRYLSSFLRDHPLSAGHPYLADLAALERSTVEVFHGEDAPTLDADAMRAIASEEWPGLKLRLHPAVQVLDVKWRVAELLRAVEQQREWTPAEAGSAKIVVSRCDNRVRYRELEQIEHRAIEIVCEAVGGAAGEGVTFGEICEIIANDAERTDVEPVATLNRLLARWLNDGIFTR